MVGIADAIIQTATRTNDLDALIEGLNYKHEIRPGDQEVVEDLVKAYGQKGDNEGTSELLRDVLEKNPLRLNERFWLGLSYLYEGRLREAKRQALIILRIDPDFTDAWVLLHGIYRAAGDIEKAREAAEEYKKRGGEGTNLAQDDRRNGDRTRGRRNAVRRRRDRSKGRR